LKAKQKITALPIALRYNFNSVKRGSNFFATLGETSFIIHDELFNYSLNKNGTVYKGDKLYKHSSKNIFANLEMSAGYEKNIGKGTSLRVEPYCQLPLKGVGIGSMHITSFGVNIGITKFIK